MDLAPKDHVRGNPSVADDAGKMWFLLIFGEESKVGKILVHIFEGVWEDADAPARQDQVGRLSDAPPVSWSANVNMLVSPGIIKALERTMVRLTRSYARQFHRDRRSPTMAL